MWKQYKEHSSDAQRGQASISHSFIIYFLDDDMNHTSAFNKYFSEL